MKPRLFLIIGAVQCVFVGGYHFVLPYAWNWAMDVDRIDPAIGWGVYAINFFFSYFLFACGVGALCIVVRRREREWSARLFFLIITLFWISNAIYQLFFPFPMPDHLSLLKIVMFGVSVISALLFSIALLKSTPKTL